MELTPQTGQAVEAAWGLRIQAAIPHASVHTPTAVYELQTDRGHWALKPFRLGIPQLRSSLAAAEKLKANGFYRLSAPQPTLDGAPYLTISSTPWLLSPWLPGKPCRLGRPRDHRLLAATLAEFHGAAHGLPLQRPEPWPARFRNRAAEIETLAHYAGQRPSPDEFDRLLSQHGPVLAAWARTAANLADIPAYWRLHANAEGSGEFAHNDYAGANVLRGPDNRGWLIDLDTLGCELQPFDLGKLISGGSGWRLETVRSLLAHYAGVRPLPTDVTEVLPAVLALPREAWWAAQRRYRAGIVEDRQLELLERTIQTLPQRKALLEAWSYL